MTQNQIGANSTSSSPFVAAGDVIYFRGTDNRLLRINSDGSDSYQIGTNTTNSTPFVFSDPLTGEWVYFQGTDNRLLKVRDDSAGSDLTWIGGQYTNSTPFVTFDATTQEVHVYFQVVNNGLYRVNSDGSILSRSEPTRPTRPPLSSPTPWTGNGCTFADTTTTSCGRSEATAPAPT